MIRIMKEATLLLFTAFVSVVASLSLPCKYPPSVWCSSVEIATECGVSSVKSDKSNVRLVFLKTVGA